MAFSLSLDYKEVLRKHLYLTEVLHFDPQTTKLTDREIEFVILCMHIKLSGYTFQSQEAFLLLDSNGYKKSKYLYWNDRIYPKGWTTSKLFLGRGNADLTPKLGLVLGKLPKALKYTVNLVIKPETIDEAKREGYFRDIP